MGEREERDEWPPPSPVPFPSKESRIFSSSSFPILISRRRRQKGREREGGSHHNGHDSAARKGGRKESPEIGEGTHVEVTRKQIRLCIIVPLPFATECRLQT